MNEWADHPLVFLFLNKVLYWGKKLADVHRSSFIPIFPSNREDDPERTASRRPKRAITVGTRPRTWRYCPLHGDFRRSSSASRFSSPFRSSQQRCFWCFARARRHRCGAIQIASSGVFIAASTPTGRKQ
jgi:hypothetical protein